MIQGLTNFALKFIWEQSETETGCGSSCLQLRIDAACFGMEVIRDGLFDFGFQFGVVLDLGTNVALEFILDEVAESSMTRSSVDINSCSCVWMLPVSSRSIAMIRPNTPKVSIRRLLGGGEATRAEPPVKQTSCEQTTAPLIVGPRLFDKVELTR